MTQTVDGATFMADERLRWKEREFQKHVLTYARDLGYTHRYHSYFSDRSEAGFPDAVLVHPAKQRVIFVEFKTTKGKVTDAQESWYAALTAAGAEAYIWRPEHWNSGEIERALK